MVSTRLICTMLNQVHITWSELEKNLDMAPATLNKYIKTYQVHITWSELEKNLDMAPATLNKYIKTLQDKGIINYYDGKYSLEDLMLETWLNHEKERTGVYPY